MNVALIIETVKLVEKYGPVLMAAKRGRDLLKEMRAFLVEHRTAEGLTAKQRARVDAVLQLEPEDVTL
jgi:hypothetical protein